MNDEPIQLPIDGVLDLHTFQPREVKSLVLEYLAIAAERQSHAGAMVAIHLLDESASRFAEAFAPGLPRNYILAT